MRKNVLAPPQFSFDHETTPAPDELSDTEIPPSQNTETASDADGDTFKLILRSAISKDITLTVRPTTKCEAIVKAFLKRVGIEAQYPEVFNTKGVGTKNRGSKGQKDPRLCIDGDKMGNDVEIGDADLDDGDLVEVVGL